MTRTFSDCHYATMPHDQETPPSKKDCKKSLVWVRIPIGAAMGRYWQVLEVGFLTIDGWRTTDFTPQKFTHRTTKPSVSIPVRTGSSSPSGRRMRPGISGLAGSIFGRNGAQLEAALSAKPGCLLACFERLQQCCSDRLFFFKRCCVEVLSQMLLAKLG